MHFITVTVLALISVSDSARILAVFPTPSISHHIVFRPLTQELARRGHEVVVITTDPAFPPGQSPPNLTEIDIHNVSYHSWRTALVNADVGKRDDMYKQVTLFIKVYTVLFEDQLQIEQVQDIIKNEKNITFDLLLLEACTRWALVYSHVHKVPVIYVSSLGPTHGIYDVMGIPSQPLLFPVVPHQRLYNLSYWEQIKEVCLQLFLYYMLMTSEAEENAIAKKYIGADIPTMSKLYDNVHMYIQNNHQIFMDSPPVPPNVIYMGGLQLKPAMDLPEDLKRFLDNSQNGVIYVSFGTNVNPSMLLPDKVKMMTKVFSEISYDILLKWDDDKLSGKSHNVKISKWLPQADLLRHPKIKVFIMQGGLQSTDEAIVAGVPLIGIPMFGDQWFNVEKYVHHKFGVKLDWASLTETEFKNAILTVIGDESYRLNMQRFRNILYDQPLSPMERAMGWIEYVLRHGGTKHLRAPAANMPWAQYYELELIVIAVFSCTIVTYISFLILRRKWLEVCQYLTSNRRSGGKKSK